MSSTAEPLLASQDDARRPLVAVDGLRVEFKTDGGTIVAVDGVSFSIDPGETVCLVGESGSGKSVTSLSLMRLVEFGGGRISGGKLKFAPRTGNSVDLAKASQDFMRELRGNQIGMIFQEPMTSLNPVFTIERQLVDGLKAHRGLKRDRRASARARASPRRAGARAGAPPETIPARIVGRHASARRHRHGDGLRAAAPDRRRTNDRAGRHDSSGNSRSHRPAEARKPYGRPVRHPRYGGRCADGRTGSSSCTAARLSRKATSRRSSRIRRPTTRGCCSRPFRNSAKCVARPRRRPCAGLAISFTAGPSVSSSRPEPRRLLEVKNLTTRYPVRGGAFRRVVANVHAVEDVSFSINVGETFSLVGKSGCGKSSCGRSILRLVEPQSGELWLNGREIRSLGQAELREARRDMQMVFQDPFASLNPLRRLRDQVAEPLINFASRLEIRNRGSRG